MFVIEFTRSFSESERDLTLTDRFKTEDGMFTVLTWLIDGYHKYLDRGLDALDCVTRTTKAWLSISKTWLQAFLDERCVVASDKACPVTEFKIAARKYCESKGEIFTLKGMRKALESVNTASEILSDGSRLYRGVALKKSNKSEFKNAIDESKDEEIFQLVESSCKKKIFLR